jgi:hypothetical protein
MRKRGEKATESPFCDPLDTQMAYVLPSFGINSWIKATEVPFYGHSPPDAAATLPSLSHAFAKRAI